MFYTFFVSSPRRKSEKSPGFQMTPEKCSSDSMEKYFGRREIFWSWRNSDTKIIEESFLRTFR
jgi:hypothetical protein